MKASRLFLAVILLLGVACTKKGVTPEQPSVEVPAAIAGCTDNCLEAAAALKPEEIAVLYGGVVAREADTTSRLLRLTDPPNIHDPRSNFTDDFKDRLTRQAFTVNGQCKVIEWNTQTGLYNKTLDTIALDITTRDPSDIPTPNLAFEHWWMSIELLMKGQREYRECTGQISENQRRLGVACKIDDKCSPYYNLIITLAEYWIPVNAWDNFFEYPPGKLTYQEHFRAGATGLNQIVAHRDACRSTLAYWRGL